MHIEGMPGILLEAKAWDREIAAAKERRDRVRLDREKKIEALRREAKVWDPSEPVKTMSKDEIDRVLTRIKANPEGGSLFMTRRWGFYQALDTSQYRAGTIIGVPGWMSCSEATEWLNKGINPWTVPRGIWKLWDRFSRWAMRKGWL